jgi:signal transduction histidine kinase
VIRDHLAHIERLSDAASRLDDLESMTETKPVDLGAVVRDRLDELRRSTGAVTVETDVAPESYVQANDLLPSVVDNLLGNAVEHAEEEPWLRVTVHPVGGRRDAVQFRVEDDGPGFDDAELAVHADAGATETALKHSDGVGLWLVRWIVDSYDGEFTVANDADGGAVVTVTLPAAGRAPPDGDRVASPGTGERSDSPTATVPDGRS